MNKGMLCSSESCKAPGSHLCYSLICNIKVFYGYTSDWPLLFFCAFWLCFNVPIEEYPKMHIEPQYQFHAGYCYDFMDYTNAFGKLQITPEPNETKKITERHLQSDLTRELVDVDA